MLAKVFLAFIGATVAKWSNPDTWAPDGTGTTFETIRVSGNPKTDDQLSIQGTVKRDGRDPGTYEQMFVYLVYHSKNYTSPPTITLLDDNSRDHSDYQVQTNITLDPADVKYADQIDVRLYRDNMYNVPDAKKNYQERMQQFLDNSNKIDGSYLNGTCIVSLTGYTIKIDMGPKRPTAWGKIDVTTGYVNFPDSGKYTFEYDPEEKTIYWNGRDSGNKWAKDKGQCPGCSLLGKRWTMSQWKDSSPNVKCRGNWSAWSHCLRIGMDCGQGTSLRIFTVTQQASGKGKQCKAANGDTVMKTCDLGPCPPPAQFISLEEDLEEDNIKENLLI